MIRGWLTGQCGGRFLGAPAPVVVGVVVGALDGRPHPRAWEGLIDTGAYRSVVPREICDELGLVPREWREPAGFDPGAPVRPSPVYFLVACLPGIGDVRLKAYGVPKSYLVLGRDLLQGLSFCMDGPRRTWSLVSSISAAAWGAMVAGMRRQRE